MSYIGYFKAAIDNYYKTKNKTPKVKKEAKELIEQFRISELYEEFEDIEEYKRMKVLIKEIYEQVYNGKGDK